MNVLVEVPAKTSSVKWLLAMLVLLFMLLLFGLVYQWFGPSPPIRVSRTTTYLTSPLRADGMPDYRADRMQRMGQGLLPAENGAVPFWQAMGRRDWEGSDWDLLEAELGADLDQLTNNLSGLKNQIIDALEMWIPEKFGDGAGYIDGLPDDVLVLLQERPWRQMECPEVAKLIEQHSEAFRILEQAASLRKFYSPIESDLRGDDFSPSLTLVTSLHAMGRMLALRANLRMGEGDLEFAWRDIKVGLLIIDSLDQDCWLDLIVSEAAESGLRNSVGLLLRNPALPLSVAEDVQGTLGRLNAPSNKLRQATAGERLFLLQQLMGCRSNLAQLKEDLGQSAISYQMLSGAIDWNVAMERGNLLFDDWDAVVQLPDWSQRLLVVRSIGFQIRELHSNRKFTRTLSAALSSKRRADCVFDDLMGTAFLLSSVIPTAIRCEQSRQLLLLATEVVKERISQGELPEQLSSEISESLSVDSVFGQPLQYRRVGPEGFVLYSLGENQKDDWGANAAMETLFGVRANGLSAREWARLLGQESSVNVEPALVNSLLKERIYASADDVGTEFLWPIESFERRVQQMVDEKIELHLLEYGAAEGEGAVGDEWGMESPER